MTGTIEAVDSVDMGFRQGGRVIEVLVQEGDRVAAGQPLARTDPLQQDQSLRVAQAALASATATLDQAQRAFDRASAMLSRGVGTRAARDQAQQQLSAASGAVERAETAVGQANRAVADTVLIAPVDAVVTSRQIDTGQIVAPAQTVISLAALSGLEAVFQSPDVSRLDHVRGAEVRLHAIDIEAPEMIAHVTEVSPLVDPATGSVTLRAQIDDGQGDISLLGAGVRGVTRISDENQIALPWTALSNQGDQPAVWVVADDGTVSLAPIQVARYIQDQIIVGGGLQPGQIVVGAGSQMLYPGRPVQQAEVTK